MTTINTIVLINALFLVLTMKHFANGGWHWKSPSPDTQRTRPKTDNGATAFVRIARFHDHSIVEQSPLTIWVAPVASPGTAIAILTAGQPAPTTIQLAEVRCARGWVGGRPSFAVGAPVTGCRDIRPLSRAIAGWELEVVSSAGTVLRCYGADAKAIASDLLRLRRLIGFRPDGWQEPRMIPRSSRFAATNVLHQQPSSAV